MLHQPRRRAGRAAADHGPAARRAERARLPPAREPPRRAGHDDPRAVGEPDGAGGPLPGAHRRSFGRHRRAGGVHRHRRSPRARAAQGGPGAARALSKRARDATPQAGRRAADRLSRLGGGRHRGGGGAPERPRHRRADRRRGGAAGAGGRAGAAVGEGAGGRVRRAAAGAGAAGEDRAARLALEQRGGSRLAGQRAERDDAAAARPARGADRGPRPGRPDPGRPGRRDPAAGRGGAAAGHQPDRARLVRAAGGPPAGPAAAPGDRRGPDRRAGRGGHRQEGAGHGHDHGGPARAPDAGAAGLPARRPRPDRQDRGDAQRHHPAPPPGGAAARLRGQRLPRAEDAGGGAARAVGDPGERAAGRSRRRARLRHTHQPRGRTARRPGARPPRPVEAGARHAGRRARGHGRPRQGGRRDLFRARQRAPHPAPHGAAARIDGARRPRPARPAAVEPCGQRAALHRRAWYGPHPVGFDRRQGGARGGRHRRRHPRQGAAPDFRALLPGGQGPRPPDRRHRAGTGDRPSRGRVARRHGRGDRPVDDHRGLRVRPLGSTQGSGAPADPALADASEAAVAAEGTRRGPRIDGRLLLLLVVVAIGSRGLLAGALSGAALRTWSTIFVSITIQALPFLVLGVLVSGAIAALVPPSLLTRALPRRPLVAVPAAGLAAGGVAPAAALTFMLAAPAINPVVLVATAVAFPGRPQMVLARFLGSLLASVAVGMLWTRLGRGLPIGGARRSLPAGLGRWESFSHTARHDFLEAGGWLVVGAMAAATLQVVVPRGVLDQVAGNHLLASVALGLLAVLLAICSEADAFVAASLQQFSLSARLVFLVVGPAVDVKLIAMQAGVFGRRFALRFPALTFVVAVGSALLVGRWLL